MHVIKVYVCVYNVWLGPSTKKLLTFRFWIACVCMRFFLWTLLGGLVSVWLFCCCCENERNPSKIALSFQFKRHLPIYLTPFYVFILFCLSLSWIGLIWFDSFGFMCIRLLWTMWWIICVWFSSRFFLCSVNLSLTRIIPIWFRRSMDFGCFLSYNCNIFLVTIFIMFSRFCMCCILFLRKHYLMIKKVGFLKILLLILVTFRHIFFLCLKSQLFGLSCRIQRSMLICISEIHKKSKLFLLKSNENLF